MIASVHGTCQSLRGTEAVVLVGGVGLQLTCTLSAARDLRVGALVELPTALVVREDGWTLFGFADEAERDLFHLLQSVNGVGPKMAATAVGTLGSPALSDALARGSTATLTSIPGVGRKLADRMVLELQDKVVPAGAEASSDTSRGDSDEHTAADSWQAAVTEGLLSLGWQRRDADAAVAETRRIVIEEQRDTADIAELLRLALTTLDRA